MGGAAIETLIATGIRMFIMLLMLAVMIGHAIQIIFTALYEYSIILTTLIVIGLPLAVLTSYSIN